MRSIFTLTIVILLIPKAVLGQTNPVITSWIQNTTGQTNPSYPSLECNVQSVYYTSDSAYISCCSIPGWIYVLTVSNHFQTLSSKLVITK